MAGVDPTLSEATTEGPKAPVTTRPDETTEVFGREGAPPPDPIRSFLTFHKRIRLAFSTLRRLSRQRAELIDPVDVAALYDFFKEDVALHDMDEEASLLPRLRRAQHPDRLDRLLTSCTRQHEHLEGILESVLPHLQAVAEGRIRPDPERLGEASRDLERVLGPHLTLEEQEIFPLARLLLSQEELVAVAREMEDRRRARARGKARAVEIYESPDSRAHNP